MATMSERIGLAEAAERLGRRVGAVLCCWGSFGAQAEVGWWGGFWGQAGVMRDIMTATKAPCWAPDRPATAPAR